MTENDFAKHQKDLEDAFGGRMPSAREIAAMASQSDPQVSYFESDADLLPKRARDRATMSGADLEGLLRDSQVLADSKEPQTLRAEVGQDGELRESAREQNEQVQVLKDLLDAVRVMPDQIVEALRS